MRTRGAPLLAVAAIALSMIAVACGALQDPEATDRSSPPDSTATRTPQPTATSQPSPTPDDPQRAIADSIDLDPAGLPTGAVGPLLVYRTANPDTLSFGVSSPSSEIVVHDIGANEQLIRIWIGDAGRQPQASLLVAPYVVVNLGDAVWRYRLDGVREPLFDPADGSVVTGIAADPAGGAVVIATQTSLAAPVDLHWIDVASASPIREVTGLSLESGDVPLPRVAAGLDQPILLRGVTYTDQPGSYAALEADGQLRELTVSGYVDPSPDGRHVAHGPGLTCETIGGPQVDITEVATDEVVASYADPDASLAPWDWSPDGTALLILARPLRASDGCADTEAAPEWLTLAISGAVDAVSSPLLLRSDWFGAEAVTFRCGGINDPGWFSRSDGLQRPSECLSVDVEIQVAGRPIALEPTATIVGWIDLS